jgi:hypothetical protein
MGRRSYWAPVRMNILLGLSSDYVQARGPSQLLAPGPDEYLWYRQIVSKTVLNSAARVP